MFISTKEFDSAVFKVISPLREGFVSIDHLRKQSGLSEEDFESALERAIDDRYVSGMNYDKAGTSIMWSILDPKLTHNGLAFIESQDTR